jgi:alcohol dehydrogenase YqhD (iron-dependent ADH family)
MKFKFENTTRIHFGQGQIKKISRDIPQDHKVLMIYGGGSIKNNGVYDQVVEALKDYQWGEFSGIEPNPQYDTLMKAVERIKAEGFDFLLAVGGGSVIDGTKFISAASRYKQGDPWDILDVESKVEDAIPLGCVLTLPAAGSESNSGAVISRGTSKLVFGSPLVQPKFAILDPVVTLSLSERQTANGIADAYVHIIEQYLTYPVNAKVQDRFAEGLLMTLIEEGLNVKEAPEDIEVRANIMWAATLALNGLIGAGVPEDWSTHLIGHELTALYGIDHARSLTIILPAVMKQRRKEKRAKLLQYAERVFDITEENEEQRIDEAIERTVKFFRELALPTSLGDVNLGAEDVEPVLANLKKHDRVDMGEHGDINLDECRLILQAAV